MSGIILVTATMAFAAAGSAEANPISLTCPTTGSPDRQATLTNAIACVTVGDVTGTPKAANLAAAFGGTWTKSGKFEGTEGVDQWLTLDVTNGSWGSLPVSGTWGINPLLWQTYSRAAISFHLGNGGGNPDWFMFEMGPGTLSGTFDIVKLSGTGGGLSNMVLWADTTTGPLCGPGRNCSQAAVPEPASLLLLGTGLAGLAIQLRKRSARR